LIFQAIHPLVRVNACKYIFFIPGGISMKKAGLFLLMVLMAFSLAFVGCGDDDDDDDALPPNGSIETAGPYSTQWNIDVISAEETTFSTFNADIEVTLVVAADAAGLPDIIMVYFIDTGATGEGWTPLTNDSEGGAIALAEPDTNKNIAAGKTYKVTPPNKADVTYTSGNVLKMQLLGKDSAWTDYPEGTKKGIKGTLTLKQGALTKTIEL
jgi:hypothetical protein